MSLKKNTITALRALYDEGVINSSRLKDERLLDELKEGIVQIDIVGKTQKKIRLLDRGYLLRYLRVEHALILDELWETLVEMSSLPTMLKDVLLIKSIGIEGKSDKAVIVSMERHISSIRDGMTKRQISAVLFWGLSKILDDRPDIVKVLSGVEIPLMLNVCGMTNDVKTVIFIENYDSYIRYISSASFEDHLLIYSAGFGSSALRVREASGCSIHYAKDDRMHAVSRHRFEAWLWRSSSEKMPVMFFGDLDYSGIEIFKSLRRSFSELIFYRPGYDAMLEAVRNGDGHSFEMMEKKVGQTDPGGIGNTYCDEVLLPVMREHGFYDQEGVLL